MEEKESLALSTLKYKEGNASTLNENTEYVTDVVIKELPSGFKGYPENTKISYVPMTFEEIEALNSSEMDPERAIAMLLKAIHCTTLPSYDLYYWDVMYIGIQRKLLAFGDTNGTLYKRCPKCGNLVSKSFSYTDLEFKELEVPALPMRMELTARQFHTILITIKTDTQRESISFCLKEMILGRFVKFTICQVILTSCTSGQKRERSCTQSH